MAGRRIRKKAKNRRLSGARCWLAMGTLAAYTAAGSGKIALARQAKQGGTANSQATQIQALPVRRYDIPAGTFERVLERFEKTAEIHVAVSDQGILNVSSPGVSGVYTVAQALQKLLENTGITYRFTGITTVKLELSTPTISVDVTASAPVLSASMPKYQGPALDLPQTIDVVPRETMQEQGTTTLRDALRNVAGISLAAGEGGSQGDNLTIRG